MGCIHGNPLCPNPTPTLYCWLKSMGICSGLQCGCIWVGHPSDIQPIPRIPDKLHVQWFHCNFVLLGFVTILWRCHCCLDWQVSKRLASCMRWKFCSGWSVGGTFGSHFCSFLVCLACWTLVGVFVTRFILDDGGLGFGSIHRQFHFDNRDRSIIHPSGLISGCFISALSPSSVTFAVIFVSVTVGGLSCISTAWLPGSPAPASTCLAVNAVVPTLAGSSAALVAQAVLCCTGISIRRTMGHHLLFLPAPWWGYLRLVPSSLSLAWCVNSWCTVLCGIHKLYHYEAHRGNAIWYTLVISVIGGLPFCMPFSIECAVVMFALVLGVLCRD